MNSLSYIMDRIKHRKVLTKEEVKELIYKYRAGDKEAGLKIIEHNIKLVIRISTYYVNRYNVEYDDVIGWGIIGLYKTLNKFDPNKGTFSTYAYKWVSQSITRYLLFKQDIVNPKEYRNQFRLGFEFIDHDTEWKYSEIGMSIKNDRENIYIQEKIAEYLNGMDERTRKIFIMRFGFDHEKGDMTLRAIGKEVNLTAERVRQILEAKLRSMRRTKKIKALRIR